MYDASFDQVNFIIILLGAVVAILLGITETNRNEVMHGAGISMLLVMPIFALTFVAANAHYSCQTFQMQCAIDNFFVSSLKLPMDNQKSVYAVFVYSGYTFALSLWTLLGLLLLKGRGGRVITVAGYVVIFLIVMVAGLKDAIPSLLQLGRV